MSASPTHRRRPLWVVPAVVVAVMLLLVAVVLMIDRNSTSEDPAAPDGGAPTGEVAEAPTEIQGAEQPDLSQVERREEGDLLSAGPVDAPVVLVVFSDYQCPFCARWSTETLPRMMEHAENGDLRIEWRDVNVYGEASERAARASYAAALQGRFWDYHDALFADAQARSAAELSEDSLITLAGELDLDGDQFAADLAAEQTIQQIEANAQLGLDTGAYSTPAFVMGGQPIIGAQPTEVFQNAFEAALDGAG